MDDEGEVFRRAEREGGARRVMKDRRSNEEKQRHTRNGRRAYRLEEKGKRS